MTARQRLGAHGMLAIGVYRLGRFAHLSTVPWIARPLWLLYRVLDILVVRILLGASIPAFAQIGTGLRLPHGAVGLFIHHNVVIGNDVTILHQVTIGTPMDGRDDDIPTIEDNVYIGAGAKVLGRLRVGRGARIGANAVVLQDVPPGATAVGVPARVLP